MRSRFNYIHIKTTSRLRLSEPTFTVSLVVEGEEITAVGTEVGIGEVHLGTSRTGGVAGERRY